MRLDGPALVGEPAVLVGYGLTNGQKGIDYRTQPRARKPGLEVAEVGPDSLADGVTTAPPRTLLVNGPSGCIGDSGGPLLSSPGGAVLGVYSLQNGESCADEHVQHQLTHVSPYRALIAEAFAAADAQPTLEAPTNGGAAGAENEVAARAKAAVRTISPPTSRPHRTRRAARSLEPAPRRATAWRWQRSCWRRYDAGERLRARE
jgi:hypothetical protein